MEKGWEVEAAMGVARWLDGGLGDGELSRVEELSNRAIQNFEVDYHVLYSTKSEGAKRSSLVCGTTSFHMELWY
jgi:hypothetical protein